jgi:cyclopropane-fatty-acyl-phospholipid synthase
VGVATFVTDVTGGSPPFRVEAYDGSSAGPDDARLTVRITRPEAIARIVTRPGELGLARAYVSGDIELEGPIYELFELEAPSIRQLLDPALLRRFYIELGPGVLKPPPPPSIEARPKGALHSRGRDKEVVSHHYDVSNRFYELFLGPSMTYSCAVFDDLADSLEVAQARKVDLIARKLGLEPGMQLLDVGCGWGSMAIHAARRYGCRVVGVTLAEQQQRYATERAARAGVADLVEFRLQDFRDVADGPYDAISSIGMFEHVGRRSMEAYVGQLFGLLAPGGRLLNHAIGRPATREENPVPRRSRELVRQVQIAAGMRGPSRVHSAFMDRYVFPDGELHEVGTVVSMLQTHGFEVRHLESIREHYALTLRRWVANLEANLEEAIEQVGVERARVWRLYMAGSAVGFERNHLQVHQILAAKPVAGGSGFELRERYDRAPGELPPD